MTKISMQCKESLNRSMNGSKLNVHRIPFGGTPTKMRLLQCPFSAFLSLVRVAIHIHLRNRRRLEIIIKITIMQAVVVVVALICIQRCFHSTMNQALSLRITKSALCQEKMCNIETRVHLSCSVERFPLRWALNGLGRQFIPWAFTRMRATTSQECL